MTAPFAEPKPTSAPIPGFETVTDMGPDPDGTLGSPLFVAEATPYTPFDPATEWMPPIATDRMDSPLGAPTTGEVHIDFETIRPGTLAVLSMRRWLAERSEARAASQLRESHAEDQMKPAVAAVKLGLSIDESRLPRDFTRKEERQVVKHRAKTKGSKALGMQAWGTQKSAEDIRKANPEGPPKRGANPVKKWRNQRVWSSGYSRGYHTRTRQAINELNQALSDEDGNSPNEQLLARRRALAAATERANNLRHREQQARRARSEQQRRDLQERAGSLRDRASSLSEVAEHQANGLNPDGTVSNRFLGANAAWNKYRAGVLAARADRLEQRADNPDASSRTRRAPRTIARGLAHTARSARYGGKILRERATDSRTAHLETSGRNLIDRSFSRLRGWSIPFSWESRYVGPVTAYGYAEKGKKRVERATTRTTKAAERRGRKYGSVGPAIDGADPTEPTTPVWEPPVAGPVIDRETVSATEDTTSPDEPIDEVALEAIVERMTQADSPEQAEWEAKKAAFEAEDHSTDGRTLDDLRTEWAQEIERRARAEATGSHTA